MQRSCRGLFNMRPFKSTVTWWDQMGRPHSRRYSRSLKGHPLCILGSVFSLTFSHNPRFKNCRFEPQKSFGLWLGKDVITGMHIVTHGWSDSQDSHYHSPHSWRLVQVGRIQEVQSCYLLMSQVFTTRKIHMIRCSSRIWFAWFASSCFSKGIKSLLSLLRSTWGLFIPSAEGASSSDQGIPHPPGLPQPPEPQVRRRITRK